MFHTSGKLYRASLAFGFCIVVVDTRTRTVVLGRDFSVDQPVNESQQGLRILCSPLPPTGLPVYFVPRFRAEPGEQLIIRVQTRAIVVCCGELPLELCTHVSLWERVLLEA